jgi:predicted kinase
MITDDEHVAAYQAAGQDMEKAHFAIVDATGRLQAAMRELIDRHGAGAAAELLGLHRPVSGIQESETAR